MKQLLRHDLIQRAIAWLAAQVLHLAYVTSRWTVIGADRPELAPGRPFLGVFWHGRMLMMPMQWGRRAPMHMLISEHADGQLISRIIAHHGINTIAGSSSNGGAAALRIMVKTLKSGGHVAVTPDGPRGPRMRAAAGIAMTARLAGVPIMPVTYASSRAKLLRSWDRLMVALPFGRGVFIWGEPIRVPPDADAGQLEAARRLVEERLNAITAEADRRCGRAPVEPAPGSAPSGQPPEEALGEV